MIYPCKWSRIRGICGLPSTNFVQALHEPVVSLCEGHFLQYEFIQGPCQKLTEDEYQAALVVDS